MREWVRKAKEAADKEPGVGILLGISILRKMDDPVGKNFFRAERECLPDGVGWHFSQYEDENLHHMWETGHDQTCTTEEVLNLLVAALNKALEALPGNELRVSVVSDTE
jgi:hypothetical protein